MIGQVLKDNLGKIAGKLILPYLLRHNTVIFTFHRVLSEPDYDNCHFGRSIVVTEQGLDRFLRHVRQQFTIISLSQLLTQLDEQQLPPTKPQAVITFDDGWRDNYTVGLPVLTEHRIPATIFLSTAYLDSPKGFWWQHLGDMLSTPHMTREQSETILSTIQSVLGETAKPDTLSLSNVDGLIETLKRNHYDKVLDITQAVASVTDTLLAPHVLSWDECRAMSAQGIEFGSHTLTHPRLSLLTGETLEEELAQSKHRIQSQDVRYVDAICYPYGDYNWQTLEESARHYKIGLTTDTGIVSGAITSRLALPRINVPETITRRLGLLNYRLLKAGIKRQ
jgi:peptidoglycan/xylan/chitin deacetylase (PgdA/CDA1 family)